MKPGILTAIILLTLVAITHMLRLLIGLPLTVGDAVVPMWVSILGTAVPLVVALMLWRERST